IRTSISLMFFVLFLFSGYVILHSRLAHVGVDLNLLTISSAVLLTLSIAAVKVLRNDWMGTTLISLLLATALLGGIEAYASIDEGNLMQNCESGQYVARSEPFQAYGMYCAKGQW